MSERRRKVQGDSPAKVELYAAIRFQRNVKEDDYIVPGGFTFVMKGKEYDFDFLESSWKKASSDEKLIYCACIGLDKNSSDNAEEITADHFKNIEKIEEFFVFVGEDGEEGSDLKPERLESLCMLIDNSAVEIPRDIIEAANRDGSLTA